MNFYHMQLHPDELNNFSKEKILNILRKCKSIGIDIDKSFEFSKKKFTEWKENELEKYGKNIKNGLKLLNLF